MAEAIIKWDATETVTDKRNEVWSFRINNSIAGPKFLSARKAHGKTIYDPAILPKSIAEWLTLDDPSNPRQMTPTWNEITVGHADPQILSTRMDVNELFLRARIEVVYTHSQPAISIFCEVGDSGHGPQGFFPPDTDPDVIERKAKELEDYVDGLEYETGWKDADCEHD